MNAPRQVQTSTEERLNYSEDERKQTKDHIKNNDILSVNVTDRVEKRKNRILGFKNVALTLGKIALDQLAGNSIKDVESETRKAFERTIGGNDTLPAYYLIEGARVRHTVGRIIIQEGNKVLGHASGFLVGPNLLLTNQHVLESFIMAKDSRVQFDYEEDTAGRLSPSAIFDLMPEVLFVTSSADGGFDFALVAVATESRVESTKGVVPLSSYGYNVLSGDDGKLLKGECINIIHYPEGQPRQISIRENRLMAVDTKELEDSWMHYETDTEMGSSGSPLYNDQWEVVGIHHRGVEQKDSQGQILAVGDVPLTPGMGERKKLWAANEGLRISKFLKEVNRLIQNPEEQNMNLGYKNVISQEGLALYNHMLNRTAPMDSQQPSIQITEAIIRTIQVSSNGSDPD